MPLACAQWRPRAADSDGPSRFAREGAIVRVTHTSVSFVIEKEE
jgi:hypothetical protein